MKPLWHKLQGGGIGEVVAAEMLQGAVDVQHEAVDLLEADHAIDWRGLPVHEGLRWARAVALLEILPLDDTRPMDEVPTRLHFAYGFKEPPAVRGATRSVYLNENRVSGWFCEWKLAEPGLHSVMAGYRVRNSSIALGTPLVVDLATVPGGTDVRREDDEGRGQIFLGIYDRLQLGEHEYRVVSDKLRNIHSITLLIR